MEQAKRASRIWAEPSSACVTALSPAGRRAAWAQAMLRDHGMLRVFWKNRAEVAPGVWRSNQPGPVDIAQLSAAGFRTVLNLRGASGNGAYLYERAACRGQGVALVDLPFQARAVPSRERLLELVDTLLALQPPLIMHCKSGADRTGFAAALWRILHHGDPVSEAARALSLRHGHNPRGRAGVLGQVLRDYAQDGEAEGMAFRVWLLTRYEPATLIERFDRWRRGRG